ncbi:MAG: cytochrome c biogenesis protein CcsA, partial [Anaerolineae bacterium]|nr:cytochrome c biogenesis protein CcsA [Anaerolineae bacterium]
IAPSAVGLTPDETAAQRIIYFHVPVAWLSMLAFGVTAIGSVVYLITSKRFWDSLAVSSAELGIVFTLAAMASGSLWAKPAWNTWWTWDPRLTTYTIMFLLYVAYFMLRSAMDDPARRARFAAVYGIFAFLSVPITFMSIRWWRTIHPVLIDPKSGFGLSKNMMPVFFLSLIAFTVFYIVLLIYRVRLERSREQVDALKEQLGY